jgi:DNA-binding NtrC family response regulator
MLQRILLIEDDPKLGRQIDEHLNEAGFDTTWLQNGDAAMSSPTAGSRSSCSTSCCRERSASTS